MKANELLKRIAKKDGKLVVVHGTQMPTEIFYAMDMASFFNEVFSMMGGPVRELYDPSAPGNASSTRCTDLRKYKGEVR
jgi:hypothetical protein